MKSSLARESVLSACPTLSRVARDCGVSSQEPVSKVISRGWRIARVLEGFKFSTTLCTVTWPPLSACASPSMAAAAGEVVCCAIAKDIAHKRHAASTAATVPRERSGFMDMAGLLFAGVGGRISQGPSCPSAHSLEGHRLWLGGRCVKRRHEVSVIYLNLPAWQDPNLADMEICAMRLYQNWGVAIPSLQVWQVVDLRVCLGHG